MTASYIDQGKVCGNDFDLGLAVHCGKVRYTGDLANSTQNAMKKSLRPSSSQVAAHFFE